MNNNQITNVANVINDFKALDLDDNISKIFKNQDIGSVRIGHFTLPKYISTTKRLFSQFEDEIKENGLYLPFQYTNEYGNGNLQNDLAGIIAGLRGTAVGNLNNTVGYINRLISYQIANSFWDKPINKVNETTKTFISELADQLKYIEAQSILNVDNFKDLLKTIEEKGEELEKLIELKSSELKQITSNLQLSNTNTEQITQLLNNNTAISEKINSILTLQQQNLDNLKTELNIQQVNTQTLRRNQEHYNQIQQDKIVEFDRLISQFANDLEFVESKKTFFEERNEHLNTLIGREVGASLFETFSQRKNELKKPVSNWNKIVIGASILTFVAVLTIFTNGFGLWGDIRPLFSWQQVVINSLKTIPFFFLLFYSISQYNKERNFQEEYAFKSAVALTIKAYADIIRKEELKDEMIINSVTAVYKSPTIHKAKLTKDENAILDTLKELIATALDTYKKK